jgi:hypothetical protein
MANLVPYYGQVLADQTAILLSLALWNDSLLCLTQSQFPPLPIPSLAALLAAECNFHGYSRNSGAPGIAAAFLDGVWSYSQTSWQASDGDVPQNAYNYFWLNAGATEVLAFGAIDNAPIPFQKNGDALCLQFGLSLNGGLTQTGL